MPRVDGPRGGGSMASQKLVRCEIRRPDSQGDATVRYVPLEIYGLWEFLMRTKHRFEITRSVASLWIDVDETPEAAYGENQYERVTEVERLRSQCAPAPDQGAPGNLDPARPQGLRRPARAAMCR